MYGTMTTTVIPQKHLMETRQAQRKKLDIHNLIKYLDSKLHSEDQKDISKMQKMEGRLREKWPNTELFLVRIVLYLDWIQRFTE